MNPKDLLQLIRDAGFQPKKCSIGSFIGGWFRSTGKSG